MAGFSAQQCVSVQINEMIYKSMKFRDGAGQTRTTQYRDCDIDVDKTTDVNYDK